jgi:ATP-dependent Clp protease ATP-binding subunit ClpA
MFEKFSEPAIKVIMIAQAESQRLAHALIGSEQILLGLIGQETGIAAQVLQAMGITFDRTPETRTWHNSNSYPSMEGKFSAANYYLGDF